jgi:6-phosphogluconolactonase
VRVETLADDQAVAQRAAAFIAERAWEAMRARGQFTLAVSGGRTPWAMLRALAAMDLPWPKLQLFQVDERVAHDGDPVRNLTNIQTSLLDLAPLPAANLHAMPVTQVDLQAAARDYGATLQRVAGTPAVLDLVHLGVGPDGHTASLVPGDAALLVSDADVALAGPYQGHRRMTLTYPVLDRARTVLWLATGEDKRAMVSRLRAADRSIPAGQVRADRAWLLGDTAALG